MIARTLHAHIHAHAHATHAHHTRKEGILHVGFVSSMLFIRSVSTDHHLRRDIYELLGLKSFNIIQHAHSENDT